VRNNGRADGQGDHLAVGAGFVCVLAVGCGIGGVIRPAGRQGESKGGGNKGNATHW